MIVVAQGVRKHFGRVTAVDGVDLEIPRGELFGVIGPDGAGKTTLFRVLTTLMLPDEGSVRINGRDVVDDYVAIRSTIGYMPGRFSLYPDLSVEENLQFFAALFGTSVEENLELVADIYNQLAPFRDRRADKLSGGMKQKLALCCALIHKPEVLFLDEPTTGVDPVSRREFWEMLGRLRDQGITILVSTPYMDEANRCDRIALMQNGRIMAVDTPAAIGTRYPRPLYAVSGSRIPALLFRSRQHRNVASCYSFGDVLHLSFQEEHERSVQEYIMYLRDVGHDDVSIERINPGIEDSFMCLLNADAS